MNKLLLLLLIFVLGCAKPVTNFEECVAAGNPVMESYPMQCRHGDQTFVQELDIEEKAEMYCGEAAEVYVCDDYIRVVSALLGGGSKYYYEDGAELHCPVVGPDSMSEECKHLLFENECEEKQIC